MTVGKAGIPMKEVEIYFKYLKTIGVDYVEPSPYVAPAAVQVGVTADAPNKATEKAGSSVAKQPPAKKWETKTTPAVAVDKPSALASLASAVAACTACGLHKTRTQTVFGSGSPDAKIMFVGEAPGADEDEQGLPFVGRAGKTLTNMIEAPTSLGVPRSEVYIANVLKCRPPGNRPPKADEIADCEHFLKAQIATIQPSFICALGTHATHTLLKTNEPIGKLRGRFFDYEGVPLLPTYHPSFLNRSPEFKKDAWKDLLTLKDACKNKFPG